MSQYSNLKPNDKYNHWTIIKYLGKSIHGKDIYECMCDCENKTVKTVEGRNLITQKSKSCGCMKKVAEEIKKQRIKEYKAKYFQDNKEKIAKRNKEKPINEDKTININYHLKSRYNTTLSEIEKLYLLQEEKCFICNKKLQKGKILGAKNSLKDNSTMVIDHNHKTGKVRGILCFNCNLALGFFKDSVDVLKMAIKYLEKGDICDEKIG